MGTLTQAESKVVPFEDVETSSDKDRCAHIVKVGKGESGTAAVLRARVEGLTVEALCGHRWVPSRDPQALPVCEECKDIWQTYKEFNDGFGDSPNI